MQLRLVLFLTLTSDPSHSSNPAFFPYVCYVRPIGTAERQTA